MGVDQNSRKCILTEPDIEVAHHVKPSQPLNLLTNLQLPKSPVCLP